MKLRKILSLLFILCLLLTMTLPVFAEGTEDASAETEEPAESEDVAESSTSRIFNSPVGAALLFERNTETILYSKDADEKMFPASLTKIMTCMLALKNGNLEDIITVSEAAVTESEVSAQYVEKKPHLLAGEQMRLEDMLYYLMLESANESTLVIAEYISGSTEAFVALMNQTALDLGCTGTHFVNPHGLHNEDHYTTASDMAKITLKALENETFCEITSSASYELPATNMQEGRTISSTNQLINDRMANNPYYYSKASGVKTGFTTPAGRCLISTATNDNLNLLSVIMHAETTEDENGNWVQRSFPETINLFEWGFENYRITTVMSTLYPVAEIPVNMAAGSETVALAPVQEVRTLMDIDYDPDQVVLDVKLHADNVDAPVEAGQILGTVTVSYDGEVLGTSQLGAITGIARSEITHQANETKVYVADNWWKWLVGILIGIAVVIVVGFFLLQYYRRQQRRRKVAARRRALELQRRRREWHLPDDE